MAEELYQKIKPALSKRQWQWLPRNNPAMKFPTDFGMIRASGETLEAVQSYLAGVEDVKDVHPEKLLSLDLKSTPSNEAAAPSPGAFEPCSGTATFDDPLCAQKRPGRLQTRSTFTLDGNFIEEGFNESTNSSLASKQRRRLAQSHNLATLLGAEKLWAQGHRGEGVKMGVFDTGIKENHPDVKNIKERTNWTHEPTLEDGLGHGSFVAGVVASTNPTCPGLAPEVGIYTFRVFTNDQVSYTSWFLDAFNYAIALEMDVVNLSIGGPDYLDKPFVEKVAEVTGAGIIMVSAIGNDGPLYGTLNNPADQNDVIGVGGVDWDGRIAGFSSRGMSTWELPLGYGRSKPDVMAYGKDVQGARIGGGCRGLSGTSVASPVVAGAVCLLASTVPAERRSVLNPASMKQALVESATVLSEWNMYEQGQGQLNVLGAAEILKNYSPRASIVPAQLKLNECPYAWPFCRQPLYAGAMPVMFNATILNGMGLVGKLESPPIWTPSDAGGRFLDVRFEYPEQLWLWNGYLGTYFRVKPSGATFAGPASGTVTFTVLSPPAPGERATRRSVVSWNITAEIIPTPPREKRILWDQFHSIRYPPVYFPRDDLSIRHDILDWHGDHPHTNFHDMYNALRDAGYYLEVLASPATCFDAKNYGAYLIVDPEDEFYPEEISKISDDVKNKGLGLIVFADWYDLDSVKKMRFYDDNTRSWWDAATGGSNIPALNEMLIPLGAAFAGGTYDVSVEIEGLKGFRMASGSTIAAMPAGAYLHNVTLPPAKKADGTSAAKKLPVLGLASVGGGKLALYGDSNCLDSSHQQSNCFKMLEAVLDYVAGNKKDGLAASLLSPEIRLQTSYGSLKKETLPKRRDDYNFTNASFVLRNPLKCYPNSPLEQQGLEYQADADQSYGSGTGVGSGGSNETKAKEEDAEEDEIALSGDPEDVLEIEDRGSRDISAQREDQVLPVVKVEPRIQKEREEEAKTYRGGGDSDADDSSINEEDLSAGTTAGSHQKSTRLKRPTSRTSWWPKLPLNVVQLSQIFSVVGGIGLIALWSLVRRRRPGSAGILSSDRPARRNSSMLPLFLRPASARERQE